jgi:hypothetical protein
MVQARRKKELLPVRMRLAGEAVATAGELADDKGMEYQTYVELLLHDMRRRRGKRAGGFMYGRRTGWRRAGGWTLMRVGP